MAKTILEEFGSIVADAAYTLEEAGKRLSLGPAAMRKAQRDGLRTKKIGRRKFVLGKWLIEFIEAAAE